MAIHFLYKKSQNVIPVDSFIISWLFVIGCYLQLVVYLQLVDRLSLFFTIGRLQ